MRRETKSRALLGAAVLLAGVSLASVQGIAQGMKEGGGPGGGAGGPSPGMSGGERGGGAPSASPGSSPKSAPGASEQRSGPSGGAQIDRGRAEQRGPAMQDRTTGQGSRDSAKPAPEPKAKAVPDKAAKEPAAGKSTGKEMDRTTGQGSRESAQPAPDSKSKSTSRPSQQPQKSQAPSDPKAGTTGAGTQTQPGSTTQSQPSASTQGQSGSVTLDAQKQASIQQSVLSANNAPRVSNVNFAISTGTVVPSRVRFVSISTFPILIETFPQYRDYSFFIVEEEIVIIEPRTRRIVQVVPVGSGRASRGGSASVEVLQLSEPEIREVQLVLVQRGLLVQSEVTGVLNERTRTALISFQRQQGLQASGSIDVRTVSSLGLTSKVGPQKSGAASSPTTGSSTSQAPAGTQQPAQPSAQQGQTGQQPQAQPGGQQSQQGTTGQGQPSAQQGQTPSTTGQSSTPSTTGQGNPPAQANPPAPAGQGNAQPPAQNRQNQNQPAR
jgi:hypothetical protein